MKHGADAVALDTPLPARLDVAWMCRLFGISRSQFHRLQREGKFDRFELVPRIGHRAWSGRLVQRYLDGEAGSSRFVVAQKPAKSRVA